jgi:hypothetical protein
MWTIGCENALPGDVSGDGTPNSSESVVDSFPADPVITLTQNPSIQITSSPTSPPPIQITSTSTPNLVPPTVDEVLPDLALGRLWIQLENPQECPLSSTELGVEVDVVNESEVDAGPFSVEVDGKVIRVENGLSAGVRMKLWFPGHSSHGLTTAMVDVYDEIVESDENNNGRSQQLAIPTLPPPCPPTTTVAPTLTLATSTPTPDS